MATAYVYHYGPLPPPKQPLKPVQPPKQKQQQQQQHQQQHQQLIILQGRRGLPLQVSSIPRPNPTYDLEPKELIHVRSTDPAFISFQKLFNEGWQHKDRSAKMEAMFVLQSSHLRALQDAARRTVAGPPLDDSEAEYFFHGTRRACSVGERTAKPCNRQDCIICCILRDNFKLDAARRGGMFGPGIYTTPISSKADLYASNHHIHSNQHAILICRVVCSRPQYLYAPDQFRRGPDPGYNSVKAVTKDKGGSVEYPEIVVYREDAIVPYGLIMYTRKGWRP